MPSETAEGAISLVTVTPVRAKEPEEAGKPSCRRQASRVNKDDLVKLQYECLLCKKENLQLKRRKLELEVQLLEEQVHSAAMS